MMRFGKWIVFGLAVWMLGVPQVRASVGFQPVSPDELRMTNEPLAPGAPAIILYRQVDRDDNSRTSHEDEYFRIKILTEEGRKYADVDIPFWKRSANVRDIKARTIRPDGSIIDFGGQVFEKDLLKGKGVRYLAKTFTLPDVQVGSIIEYSFTIDYSENVLYDSHWILSSDLFTKKAQFTLRPYPRYYGGFSLRWSWLGLPAGATPKQDPDGIVRMEATNIPAFQLEDYMPPPDELKSRVDFIYERGSAGNDQDTYWKRVGKAWNGYLETFVGKRKEMEQAVAQIVAANDPPETKLRKIYTRVQQIRNTSYEMTKTEQEEKREKEKPAENVEDVWKRGYGNSVQLTWLFLGLVRAAGFEASGCWVSDRQHFFFTPVTMQSDKLNTNVVLVKLDGRALFFDPGTALTPFGLLTWPETGVKGLCLDKDGGSWIKTMIPEASQSRIERVGKLRLDETGDITGTLTLTYSGLEALHHRLEELHEDDVERKKYLETLATEQIPVPAEAMLTNKPDWTSSETPLVAEFELKIPGWASAAGRRTIMPAAILTAGEKGLFDHATRVHPIYFSYPFEKSDDLTVSLPAGWHATGLPAQQDQDGHVIVYKRNTERGNGTVRLTRQLTVKFLLLDQKYYDSIRSFFQTIRNGDEEQVVLSND
ncbi:MAG: DUF3857 domain-containing protein [Terriglobales bacterium]